MTPTPAPSRTFGQLEQLAKAPPATLFHADECSSRQQRQAVCPPNGWTALSPGRQAKSLA